MLRDGFHQDAVHGGVAPYRPNSLDGGCPFVAGADDGAFLEAAVTVAGTKTRSAPASYDDHFSQVRQFWLSMTPVEQDHIVLAYTFELTKCFEQTIRERQLAALANVDPDLCARVAAGLGLPVPDASEPLADLPASPALSQVGGTFPADGRTVGIVVDEDTDAAAVDALAATIRAEGLLPLVVGPHAGTLASGLPVQRTFAASRSVEFDAVLVAGASVDPKVVLLLQECFRHAKAIGSWGPGSEALVSAGIDQDAVGVVTAADGDEVWSQVHTLMLQHRAWDRFATG
jgi:catalase